MQQQSLKSNSMPIMSDRPPPYEPKNGNKLSLAQQALLARAKAKVEALNKKGSKSKLYERKLTQNLDYYNQDMINPLELRFRYATHPLVVGADGKVPDRKLKNNETSIFDYYIPGTTCFTK